MSLDQYSNGKCSDNRQADPGFTCQSLDYSLHMNGFPFWALIRRVKGQNKKTIRDTMRGVCRTNAPSIAAEDGKTSLRVPEVKR
jgi:hypothetical protein